MDGSKYEQRHEKINMASLTNALCIADVYPSSTNQLDDFSIPHGNNIFSDGTKYETRIIQRILNSGNSSKELHLKLAGVWEVKSTFRPNGTLFLVIKHNGAEQLYILNNNGLYLVPKTNLNYQGGGFMQDINVKTVTVLVGLILTKNQTITQRGVDLETGNIYQIYSKRKGPSTGKILYPNQLNLDL